MNKNILKGFIIGVAKIVPGVSGSMLAISLGVYEKMLGIIADLCHVTWRKFYFLACLVLGAFIGVSIFSRGIQWLLAAFYLPTMLLFIGLIVGGFPAMVAELRPSKVRFRYLFIFLISLTFSYVLTCVGSIDESVNGNVFLYFILGLIEAFSSIVPGISGTAIFMSLGCYDMLLSFFSNIFNPSYLKFGIFFMFGVVAGIYILAKVITFLLSNHKRGTYYAITGFMLSSLIIMFQEIIASSFLWYELIFGVALFVAGYKVTIKINNLLTNE